MKNTISIRFLMDRLNDNPNMKSLKLSTVASYMRDLASIVGVVPMLGVKYMYLRITDNKAEFPPDLLELKKVYLCKDTELNNAYFENNSLNAALDRSVIKDKTESGSYIVSNGFLFADLKDNSVVEIEYKAMVLDDMGLPVFPYDGSLMQAMEWYIKWRYYTILAEIKMIDMSAAANAERQYAWYIGQYVAKAEMLDYDQAVSMANSWQRLIDTRYLGDSDQQFKQYLSTGK